LTALKKLGFDARLIPSCSWRPQLKSFVKMPSHCSVIVVLDEQQSKKWILLDVATVDCIDGVLVLSDKLGIPQTVTNGMRYKFTIGNPHTFEIPSELVTEFNHIDPSFLSQKYLTIILEKEDVKRDSHFDPIEPREPEWTNRFAMKLPLIDQSSTSDSVSDYLPSLVRVPDTLDPKIGLLLVEYTTIKDPKSHHYKQWVGIKYAKDGKSKKIVAGFRFIQTERPFSKRNVTWMGGGIPNTESEPQPELLQSALNDVLAILEKEIGLKLLEDQISRLKVHHNYMGKNINHVWAY